MVPLKDENPTRSIPYVTYTLIGLNILVFLYELSLAPQSLTQFFYHWAVVPNELTTSLQWQNGITALDVREWSTLISAQFLHAGFLHLGGNMLYLWIFGNNVEDEIGKVKFVIFYLTCGIVASLAQWFFARESMIPSLGASGAIAGVMGAYILRYPKVNILTFIPLGLFFTTVRVPAYVYLGFWFVQQALYGLTSLDAPAMVGMENGGVAYWAHAGGFVVGAVLGPMFGLFNHAEARSQDPYLQS